MMDGMSGEMKGVKNGASMFFFLSFLVKGAVETNGSGSFV